MSAVLIVNKLLEDAPGMEDAEVDPNDMLDRLMADTFHGVAVCLRLAAKAVEYGFSLGGQVTRHSSHYVHENSTEFDLFTENMPYELGAPVVTEIDGLVSDAEEYINDERKRINHKIYVALERAYDFENSDETVDSNIEANNYIFNEEGEQDDEGGFTFAALNNEGKENARNWYREASAHDDFWSAHVIEEWKEELETMGFGGKIEISYRGFSSQGDGASFTATRFDFNTWTNWWNSSTPTTRGHPYSDDLFRDQP